METAAEGNRAITINGTKQQRSILESEIWFLQEIKERKEKWRSSIGFFRKEFMETSDMEKEKSDKKRRNAMAEERK